MGNLKVEELRRGNLFQLNLDKSVYKVDHFSPGTEWLIWVEEDGKVNSYIKESDAGGIELTEEWLLKFGGELDENGQPFIYEDKENDIRYYIDGEYLTRAKGVFTPLSQFRHIKYVHQIQNLFHIHTGTELELTK